MHSTVAKELLGGLSEAFAALTLDDEAEALGGEESDSALLSLSFGLLLRYPFRAFSAQGPRKKKMRPSPGAATQSQHALDWFGCCAPC